jgi:hypothetical protein
MLPDAPRPDMPVPAMHPLTCPGCGGTVELRAAGYTVHVACQYCGSILDVTNPDVKLVTRYQEANTALDIPLGTRGTLRGVEWEAIGWLRRSQDGYPWEEYLLFNPYHGYRWLVNVRGGWSFGTMLTRTPEWRTYDTFGLDAKYYQRFFYGDAQVDDVLGEFYWRVAVGETVKTGDWVRPGEMLSREEDGREVSWTLNEWVPEKEIVKAFGASDSGRIWPPLPHQPSPWGGWLKSGAKIGAAALAFLLLFSMFFGGTGWSAAGSLAVARDGRDQTATLGPITFRNRYQRIEIRADVPRLENGWVDLDYSLVDRKTQQVYDAYGAAERYSGSDSDGAWTEGSRNSDISIASVPAGTYDLVVDYKGNRWTGASGYSSLSPYTKDPAGGWMDEANAPKIEVEVRQGTLFGSNILIALLLLAGPWLIALALHLNFEKARVNESDYAPAGDDD